MSVGGRVEGLDEALENIDKAVADVEKKSQAGFWEAGLKVLASAQKRLKASVVTGNLRASGYVRSKMDQERPMSDRLINEQNEPIPGDDLPAIGVEVGFTAVYALNVHENMEGRTPKFLENAVTENERAIVEIIKRTAGGR